MSAFRPSNPNKVAYQMPQLSSEDVACGSVGSTQPMLSSFSPKTASSNVYSFLYPDSTGTRQLFAVRIDADHINDITSASTGDNGDMSGEVMLEPYKLIDTTSIGSKSSLSLQEQLARERMRLYGRGIGSYEWTIDSTVQKLMIPLNGSILICDTDRSDIVFPPVGDSSNMQAVDPHVSPNGNYVAFVMKDDLYAIDISTSDSVEAPLRLTTNGSKAGITCGLADYVAQEEMDRYRGFWWSPDSSYIAYTEVYENHIPEYTIHHQGKPEPTTSEMHRYPFAGASNPLVKLAVVALPKNDDRTSSPPASVWMDVIGIDNPHVDPNDYYIARVGWWPDGSVMAQIQNREQNILQLIKLNPLTGERTVMIEEVTDVWTNLHDMLYTFPLNWRPASSEATDDGSFYFIWASERSGFSHLYYYEYNASSNLCVCLLDGNPIGGGGEWVVESIDDVDTEQGLVYFSGNKDDSTQKHSYVASLTSTSKRLVQLTHDAGFHTVSVNCARGMLVDNFNSILQPPVTKLYHINTQTMRLEYIATVLRAQDKRLLTIQPILQVPKIIPITCPKSHTQLVCCIYTPSSSIYGPGPYPTVVSTYGGPHVQTVQNKWLLTADLRAQRLAQEGFLVLKCDNRGSSRRGLHFEGAMRHNMGYVEVIDQQSAVEHFVGTGLVNPSKVGIFGWSYGGYLSAMCLFRGSDTFTCAISGAPVTSWDGYDTHYTERYMGLPAINIEGYKNSAVASYVKNMPHKKLLLIHGLIDENVHFRHTARLINKLIEVRMHYDLIIFPDERHGPQRIEDRIYLEDRMYAFLVDELKNNNDNSSRKRNPSYCIAETNAGTGPLNAVSHL